ncbi:hypothetical protein P9232_01170, partial [Weizmannia sp. CD-2023]|nr:hypothetical protein [Weizmannia sp. CD-2023]
MNTKNNEYSENDFLKKFEKTVEKSLYQTDPQERDDLRQELYMKIYEKSSYLNFKKETPSFWDSALKSK